MLNKQSAISGIAGLGLLFANPSVATAQMSDDHLPQTNQFHVIEQPLELKVGVTVGGVALIGLELWWFLLSKSKSQKANLQQGIQELDITVDGGYEPSRIVVNVGQPVRLNFFRRDPSSCLEQVLFPDFQIAQNLQLNQVTTIEFTPEQQGQYTFTCGMSMFRGVLEVK